MHARLRKFINVKVISICIILGASLYAAADHIFPFYYPSPFGEYYRVRCSGGSVSRVGEIRSPYYLHDEWYPLPSGLVTNWVHFINPNGNDPEKTVYNDPNATSRVMNLYARIIFSSVSSPDDICIDPNRTTSLSHVVVGSLYARNIKAAVVDTDSGQRVLHAFESPQAKIEDEGEARLVKGKAVIEIDKIFAEVMEGKEYVVRVTPLEDCNGLYVSEYSANSFTIKELSAGKSDASFSWQVSAVVKGHSDKRFREVVRDEK